ncbi:MAG TPA: hypothetical protein VMZ27_18190 [Candidatus Saccharimonadales bacterium]|nr:hypothetical protein [Candidatus Saccharimonadales bacterium]
MKNKNKPSTSPAEAKLSRRTEEVALNHGRKPEHKTKADETWAKRELKPMKITSPGKP